LNFLPRTPRRDHRAVRHSVPAKKTFKKVALPLRAPTSPCPRTTGVRIRAKTSGHGLSLNARSPPCWATRGQASLTTARICLYSQLRTVHRVASNARGAQLRGSAGQVCHHARAPPSRSAFTRAHCLVTQSQELGAGLAALGGARNRARRRLSAGYLLLHCVPADTHQYFSTQRETQHSGPRNRAAVPPAHLPKSPTLACRQADSIGTSQTHNRPPTPNADNRFNRHNANPQPAPDSKG